MESIVKIKNPNLPGLLFEWHPQSQKVYKMKLPTFDGEKIEADVLAEHCDTHGRAIGFVQTWFRGYREGQLNPSNWGLNL